MDVMRERQKKAVDAFASPARLRNLLRQAGTSRSDGARVRPKVEVAKNVVDNEDPSISVCNTALFDLYVMKFYLIGIVYVTSEVTSWCTSILKFIW